MYTHARQFPHLAGMTDREAVVIYRRALEKRPKYRTLWQAHHWVLFFVITPLEILALHKLAGIKVSSSFMIAGFTVLALGLAWNVVWVNTVTFRITKEEVESQRSTNT